MHYLAWEEIEKFNKQWIALDKNNKVVGNGTTIQKTIEKANKNGVKKPTLLYISPALETCVA